MEISLLVEVIEEVERFISDIVRDLSLKIIKRDNYDSNCLLQCICSLYDQIALLHDDIHDKGENIRNNLAI